MDVPSGADHGVGRRSTRKEESAHAHLPGKAAVFVIDDSSEEDVEDGVVITLPPSNSHVVCGGTVSSGSSGDEDTDTDLHDLHIALASRPHAPRARSPGSGQGASVRGAGVVLPAVVRGGAGRNISVGLVAGGHSNHDHVHSHAASTEARPRHSGQQATAAATTSSSPSNPRKRKRTCSSLAAP